MQLLTINRFFLATITLSLTLFIFSCKKESVEKAGPAVSEAEAAEYSAESMETEASYDDIQDIGMTTADDNNYASYGFFDGFLASPPTLAVPEPTTLTLVLLGTVGLWRRRHQPTRSNQS